MDWDWDDGPPQDAPRGAPQHDRRSPVEPPSGDAPGSSTFADAIEHFDRSAPPPDDDERTQLIKMPPDAGAPPGGAPPPDLVPPPRSDPEPAPPGAIERVRRGTPAAAPAAGAPAAYAAGPQPADERRPRPTRDRAAARARRRKQIRRRRLVALAVIIVIVVLLAVLVIRSCGGPTESQAAPTPSPSAALRTPTAAEPLRMAAYGESVGGGALLGVKLLTEQRKDIKVHRFVKVASGLARPDFFDWPAYLKQDMAKRKQPFEAVALMLGANDGQDVKVDGKQLKFGTDAWRAMYAGRVGAVMDYYVRNGVRRVYWAGMPRMGVGWFNEHMDVLNGIYKAEAAKRAPRVQYVDEWKAVDAPAATYQADLRQSDGVHLETSGGLMAAKAIMTAVAKDWHLPAFTEQQ